MPLTFDPWVAFIWCVFAGFVMSMGVGGGGVLAGIGHLSILGIADANQIKVLNQILEFASRIVAVPLYQRQRRISWSLALAFSAGAPFGAVAGSWASKAWLSDIGAYRIAFGLLVLAVAARVGYEAWGAAVAADARLRRAREASSRGARDGAREAPRTLETSLTQIRVRFAGELFDFSPWTAAAGGFAIAFVGALLGIAGGFLITPFLASVLFYPVYLATGTSLVASMVPLVASVLAYFALDVRVDWRLLAFEVPGIVVGSMFGPLASRRMNDRALKTFIAVVLFAIGLYYVAF